VGLADGDQRDLVGLAPRDPASIGNPRMNGGKTGFWLFQGAVL
jgi:hypothetical protein